MVSSAKQIFITFGQTQASYFPLFLVIVKSKQLHDSWLTDRNESGIYLVTKFPN